MRGERRGSLLWVLDETMTPMGGRLLRDWLLAPLTDAARIGERLDAVESLRDGPTWRQGLEVEVRAVGDRSAISSVSTAGSLPGV
jgi:DNA mismatch repair protein MutS